MKTLNGIDVSKWQEDINWQKVKSAGVDFAVVKLGNGLSNGNLSVDPYFTKNFKGALSVGLRVGVYVFMYGTSVSAAKLVAENTVATLSTSKNLLSLPVFFDLEWDDTAATGRTNCTAMAVAWRDVIAKAGFVPGLYTNPNWLKNYISCPDNCKLWLAHYAKTPYCSSYIWQYTMAGRVDGINTDVDKNILYYDDEKKEEPIMPDKTTRTDNTPDDWAIKEGCVKWATEEGIMRGDANGNFRLHDPITRQEMCAMLYRAFHQTSTK